jgi:hypothetical protein
MQGRLTKEVDDRKEERGIMREMREMQRISSGSGVV